MSEENVSDKEPSEGEEDKETSEGEELVKVETLTPKSREISMV